MKALIFVLLIGIIGCRQVISEQVVSSARTEETISCNYYGFCYTCWTFDMKFDCAYRLSHNCAGTQRAIVERKEVERRFDDGKSDTIVRQQVLERLGGCSG